MTDFSCSPPRPWLNKEDSFSSLAGLEIAIPPGLKIPSCSRRASSSYSEYSGKALPPIPSRSSRRSRFSSEMEHDGRSTPTSKPSRKVLQLMGIQIDTDGSLRDPPRSQSQASRTSRTSQKVFQLMGVHVDTDSSKDTPRSQSRMSFSSSASGYSQDSVDADIDQPALMPESTKRPSSVEDVTELQDEKGKFYLQAVTYSASASKIEPSKSKSIPSQLEPEPASLRPRDRVQSAYPHEKSTARNGRSKLSKPKSPPRSQTLDEMISYERKRYVAEEFARKMWKPTIGRPEQKGMHTRAESPTQMKKEMGSSKLSTVGFPYSSASTLAPAPLVLPPLASAPLVLGGKVDEWEDRRQSLSHFSDQDSDDDSPGMMANARDSVMSHIRRTVKPPSPSTSSPHPICFSDQTKQPGRLMLPPAASKRKRASKGKHPPKSPFPFQNTLKHKKPIWPPPGQQNTKLNSPSFSKRLSGVMKRFSTGSESGTQSPLPSSILTTESRDGNGSDTPFTASPATNTYSFPSHPPPPIRPSTATGTAPPPIPSISRPATATGARPGTAMGMATNMASTFISNININISSPKFMKDKDGEGLLSPKEILEKGGMRFVDAMESARKKAGVKTKAEKRREFIRANIVKIGQADQFPDGRVNRWL